VNNQTKVRKLFLSLALAAYVLLTSGVVGCTNGPVGGVVRAEELKSDKPRLEPASLEAAHAPEQVAGNTAFALDLYHTLLDEGENNLLFSPYSLSVALAMTYAGARGETEREMAEVLHLLAQDQAHPAFNALDQALDERGAQEGVALQIANALWPDVDYPFLDSFLDLLAEHYGAGLRPLDFTQAEAARQQINRWASDQTKGHIPELFEDGDIDELTRLVLCNAIYFKADWHHKFREDDTFDGSFTLADGSSVTVPLMRIDVEDDEELELGYAEFADVEVLEMDYEDQELSMVVVLPTDPAGLPDVEESLTAEQLDDWIDGLVAQNVNVTFPSFEMEYELPLASSMQALGIVDAFDLEDADLTGFAPRDQMMMNWYVSAARHKAYVKVDEQGTEAAAATGIGISDYTAGPIIPHFEADHPFLFAIRDKLTGAILFMGRIEDPR